MLENLEWVMLALLVIYAPVACYYDLKHREMPIGFWTLMVTIGLPVTVLLYATGIYPIEALYVSLGMVFIYFVLLIAGFYQGADFWYLAWISLFFVTNPLSGHSLMATSYFIFLITAVVVFAIAMRLHRVRSWMTSKDLPGFPMMLPISLALIFTAVLG